MQTSLNQILAHRRLLKSLVMRDLAQRYQGTVLGAGWALLYPFLMLGMYVFVFQSVFSARWPNHPGSVTSSLPIPESLYFAFNLFAGLLVVSSFSEVIGRAPRIVSDQPQLVRRVVFPLPLLAMVLSISAWLQTLLQCLILVVVLLLSMLLGASLGGMDIDIGLLLAWLLVRVPLAIGLLSLLLPFLCALAWLLSAAGTYIKDLSQLSPALSAALMFLGPVFYPISSVPEAMQGFLYLNPASLVIECLRELLLLGLWPSWSALCGYGLLGMAAFGLGYWLFVRVQAGFADVV